MHAYVVLGGRYKSGLANLTNEAFQTGVRFVVAPGSAPDVIGTLPADADVYPVAATISRDETNWTIQSNWNLEMGITDLDVGDWLNDQLAPAVVALWNSGRLSSSGYIETIKVYPINSSGIVAPAAPYASGTPATLQFKTSTYCDGGGGSTLMPPQISVVASMRTSQIGRSSRGRMYLPALDAGELQSDGTFGTANATTMAGEVATFLESAALDGGSSGAWACPAVIPGNWTTYALINSVRVGNIYDTQRRRRRGLTETYASDTVTNPL